MKRYGLGVWLLFSLTSVWALSGEYVLDTHLIVPLVELHPGSALSSVVHPAVSIRRAAEVFQIVRLNFLDDDVVEISYLDLEDEGFGTFQITETKGLYEEYEDWGIAILEKRGHWINFFVREIGEGVYSFLYQAVTESRRSMGIDRTGIIYSGVMRAEEETP